LKASLPSWLSGLLVLIVMPFFFISGPDALSSTFLNNMWNFGHIVFFALAVLLIQAFTHLETWRHWLIVTLVSTALGCLIEFVQYFIGRNSSLGDVLHNLFGVWLGLFWGQKPIGRVWLLRVVSVLLVLPAFWLVVDSGMANIAMRYQFPQLNSFDSRSEMQQVKPNLRQVKIQKVSAIHTHGSHALQVVLSTHRYAGVSLLGPSGDWGKYKVIAMDFYNPDAEPLELVIRISDLQHDRGAHQLNDRFNRRLVLIQGWNQVQIDLDDVRTAPHDRAMRMDEISNITVFAMKVSEVREFYWDNVRLQ
jgi:VanZ family protein